VKTRPIAVEIAVGTLGAVFVVAAMAATQRWLDSHFLPSFFLPRRWYAFIETGVRGTFLVTGLWLIFWRSRLATLLMRVRVLPVVAPACLAIVAADFALRWIDLRPTEWLLVDEEPRRQPDSRLGWVLSPARVGYSRVGGRVIEYAIDPAGYRVRRVEEPVDPERPTIVFAGESVMFGEGLTWEESIPAQTAAILGVNSANLAVHGYSTDQMYLRLERELPRFSHPRAVITIFMPELFGRNLDTDRPHLAPGLLWRPAVKASRPMAIAALVVPFRRSGTVEQGLDVTREVFRAIGRMARARGALPVVVIPQFEAGNEMQRILQDRALPDDVVRVPVPLAPDWRLRWDRHPNAHAAHVIATAIASRLR
jgi:hypothetical protein